MIYTDYDKLTIVKCEDAAEEITFSLLEKVILNRPSNVIYCESRRGEGKLNGIISMGDIARADKEGKDYVIINKSFTSIRMNEYMRAKEIFNKNFNINAIPVIDEENRLTGSYSRWDDLFYQVSTYDIDCVCKCLKHVFLVRPCRDFAQKQIQYHKWKDAFRLAGVMVESIAYEDIADYIGDTDEFVFVDEDECRAMDTLYRYILNKKCETAEFYSIHRFVEKCKEESFGRYFQYLKQNGVHTYNLVWKDSGKNKEYLRKLKEELSNRCDMIGKKVDNLLDPTMYGEFFDDLYKKDYVDKIMNIGYFIETESGCGKLKDFHSELYNAAGGERHTCGQPEHYEKTVWFVGPCYIFGYYAEDKNTIESFLQKRLKDNEYNVRVVNCGSPAYSEDIRMLCARIQSLPLRRGDILIYGYGHFRNTDEINLLDTCRMHHVSAKWMVDHPMHCNHHLYSLYADAIYDIVEPIFAKRVNEEGQLLTKESDFVKEIYIDRYFNNLHLDRSNKTGSIVMNCNPFTYGHRYLIEQALDVVDFLIIFVVEENRSLFSFTERFAMVRDGVKDLKNVMVVPSGPFVLSRTTFPEYFLKAADEDLVENVENDITLFAQRIAPHLNITYRFVGEEPEDSVTNEYNLAMKRILPKKGIQLVEIPRRRHNGSYISASAVRRCLGAYDLDGLKGFVPESTMKVLFAKNE